MQTHCNRDPLKFEDFDRHKVVAATAPLGRPKVVVVHHHGVKVVGHVSGSCSKRQERDSALCCNDVVNFKFCFRVKRGSNPRGRIERGTVASKQGSKMKARKGGNKPNLRTCSLDDDALASASFSCSVEIYMTW